MALKQVATETLLAWLCLSSALAQTPDELRQKYGRPVSETYAMHANLMIAVDYSSTGRACEMRLFRGNQLGGDASKNRQSVADAIEEVFPTKSRGAELEAGFVDGKCDLHVHKCGGSYTEWERVKVYFWSFDSRAEPGDLYATIQFKETDCQRHVQDRFAK